MKLLIACLVAIVALTAASVPDALAEQPVDTFVVLHDIEPSGGVNCYLLKQSGSAAVDLSVGSVARGVLESMAQNAAALWGQLREVYEESFVDTASGTVSAVAVDDAGKLIVNEQWQLTILDIAGAPAVEVSEPDQDTTPPRPESCR